MSNFDEKIKYAKVLSELLDSGYKCSNEIGKVLMSIKKDLGLDKDEREKQIRYSALLYNLREVVGKQDIYENLVKSMFSTYESLKNDKYENADINYIRGEGATTIAITMANMFKDILFVQPTQDQELLYEKQMNRPEQIASLKPSLRGRRDVEFAILDAGCSKEKFEEYFPNAKYMYLNPMNK